MENFSTKYSKTIISEEIKYEFSIESIEDKDKGEENLLFSIEKELDVNYSQKEIKYSDLQKEYPFLFMKQQKFFLFI